MKKLLILLSLLLVAIFLKAQTFPNVDSVRKYINDSVVSNRALKATSLQKAYTGVAKFLPYVTQDSANITQPAHGFFIFQRKDSALYVYDTIVSPKRWRKASAAIGGGSANTSIGSGFPVGWTGTNNVRSLFPYNGLTGDTSGSANTIQVGLGGTLSNSPVINGAGTQSVQIINTTSFSASANNSLQLTRGTNRYLAMDATSGARLSDPDSVKLWTQDFTKPFLKITSTNASIPNLPSGVGTKAVRYNPATGNLTIADTTIGGGGGGSTLTSLGSAYKVAVNGTNNTKSIAVSNGILADTSTTGQIGFQSDTNTVRTVVNSYNLQTGQAQKNSYGTLVNTTSFASLSGYTQNGGTWTVASGHVTPSGASNDYTKSLDFNLYTAVKKYKIISLLVPTAVSGNGGWIGKRGTYTSVFAWFNLSDSTLRIQSSTSTTLATSAKLNFAANDTLKLYFERNESNVYAVIRDITTNTAPVHCEYRYEMATGATLMDGMGTASVGTRGDNFNVVSFAYMSDELKQADLLVIGTSKQDHEYVTTQAYSYISQLRSRNNMDIVSLAGSSSQSKDWTPLRQELLALNPKKLLIGPPCNDKRASVSTSVTHANIEAIFNTADSAGIDTYLEEEDYEVGQDNSAWNTYLAATFPANKIVHKDYNLMKAAGALQPGDGIHDTPYGDSLKYNAIILDGKLTATKGRASFPTSNFDNTVVGRVKIVDNPSKTFSQLVPFGGDDVTYPMLQRNGSIIEIKAADNSSFNQDLKQRDDIASGGVYVQGLLTNHTGSGMRLGYSTGGTASYIQSLTDPATYLPIHIQGSTFTLENAFSIITTDANNFIGLNSSNVPLAYLHLQASNTTGASMIIPTGAAPTTKRSGQLYHITPQLFFVNGGLQPQEIPQIQQSRVTTQFDVTSSTTLANITGLTATLVAGHIYRFESNIYTTSNSGGGVKFSIAGTATATSVIYDGFTTDAGVTTQGPRATSMASTVGAVTAVTAAYFRVTGTITVNAGGTFTLQFAQNASNGTASSVLVGSTFVITEMP